MKLQHDLVLYCLGMKLQHGGNETIVLFGNEITTWFGNETTILFGNATTA